MKFKRFSAILATVLALSLTACNTADTGSSVTDTTSVTDSATDSKAEINVGEEILDGTSESNSSDATTTANSAPSESTETEATILPVDSFFSIHYIDVGQADAALIRCDDSYMLIDGGNVEDSNLIYSVLEQGGITNLDILVGTHAHEDHIGGLSGALEYATADLVLCPVTDYDSKAFQNFKDRAEDNANGIVVPEVGDTYELGRADVTILGVNSTEETNDTSIVLMVEYGETSFLFTADAEYDAEQTILASGADLSCDVLKVGHHGSDSSTSYVWLNAIMPEYAVISVGEGNTYSHPTDAVLSRLRDADVTTYRTDLNGDIYSYSDGKTVTMSVTREASEDAIFTAGDGTSVKTESTPAQEQESVENSNTDNSSAEEVSYILNTNSMKFHEAGCSSADKISDSNRSEYTGTRDDLISQGYSPCGYCKP